MNSRLMITQENAQQQAKTLLASLSQLYPIDMDLITRYRNALNRISDFYDSINFNDDAALAAFASGLKGTPFKDVKTRQNFIDTINKYSDCIFRLDRFIEQLNARRELAAEVKSQLDNLFEHEHNQLVIDYFNASLHLINTQLNILDNMLLAMNDVNNPLSALNILATKYEQMSIIEDLHTNSANEISRLTGLIGRLESNIQREQESQTLAGRISSLASNISSFFGYSSARSDASAPADLPENRKRP